MTWATWRQLVPVRKQPGLKAPPFSPALLVPVAPTETNGPYKPRPMAFFPLVTFVPGMGRPYRFCPFVSGRWVAIYLFFCPRGRILTRGGRLRRPAGDALTTECMIEESKANIYIKTPPMK
jgi:hypothetical protein